MTQKDKKLKTNQMMTIEIPRFGIIEVGHKTEMGDVSQVIEMGNRVREEKSLKPIPMDEILRRSDLWEFVIARNTHLYQHSNSGKLPELKSSENYSYALQVVNGKYRSDFSELEKFKDLFGRIQYSELMKKFPHLINSRRGRYGGTKAELYILLKIASMLDKDLEVAIYDVFIKSQILQYRDNGGDSFKKLNIAIDKYIPSESGNSRSQFMHIAKMLRVKLGITETKGYNEKEHHSEVKQKRDEIEKHLIFALQTKLVTSYEKLKNIIENSEIED